MQLARAVRRFADRCLSNRCGRAAVAAAFGDFRHLRVACDSAVERQQPRRRSERLRVAAARARLDPRTIRSITVNLAADGYEGRHEELATQPGSTTSFRLALVRSQPNGFDRPTAENQSKAQTSSSMDSGFQVATAKSIEPKPKPQELSHDMDSPGTESPDAFDGDRPGKVRMDNGLKTMLVWIPPGHFIMGTPPEQGKRQDEGPVEVTLTQGFWLGTYEVTQSEWQSVMHTAPWHGQLYVQEAENDAASYINWDEATAFCTGFTKQEHAAGRLPTNWKYALPTEGAVGIRLPGRHNNAVQFRQSGLTIGGVRVVRKKRQLSSRGIRPSSRWDERKPLGSSRRSRKCVRVVPRFADTRLARRNESGSRRQRLAKGASRGRMEVQLRRLSFGFTQPGRCDGSKSSLGFSDRCHQASKFAVGSEGGACARVLKTREEVNTLIIQSYEMLKNFNLSGARKTLEKASRMDQSSIVADGTLGLLSTRFPRLKSARPSWRRNTFAPPCAAVPTTLPH